jgi:hypothetical protein
MTLLILLNQIDLKMLMTLLGIRAPVRGHISTWYVFIRLIRVVIFRIKSSTAMTFPAYLQTISTILAIYQIIPTLPVLGTTHVWPVLPGGLYSLIS